ncbi:hypothetical protein BDW71DRAFT_181632 [Aspergillus fruticulosus]
MSISPRYPVSFPFPTTWRQPIPIQSNETNTMATLPLQALADADAVALILVLLVARVPAVTAADPRSTTSSLSLSLYSSSSPTSQLPITSNSQAHPSRGSKAGIFIGATVGVLAIVAAVILFFCLRGRRRRRRLSLSAPVLISTLTPAVEMETNKAVAVDAVLRTPGPDLDDHNQHRPETNSQYQQPETESMETNRMAGMSNIK